MFYAGRLAVGVALTACLLSPCAAGSQAPRHRKAHVSRAAETGGFERLRHIRSPDGRLTAVIEPVNNGINSAESRIEIRTKHGTILRAHSYASRDGEHGYGVDHAAWIPDSRFFVWSRDSSGGHSPWHFPTDYYDRRANRIRSLDDAVGNVTTARFTVHRPDIVSTRVKRGMDFGVPVRVRLSRLKARSHLRRHVTG